MKYANVYTTSENVSYDQGLKEYMYLIYKNMGLSLLISALVAFFVSRSNALLSLLFSNWLTATIVSFAPIFFIFSINKSIYTGSIADAKKKLFIFSTLMGLSLSTVFVFYNYGDIFSVFLTTSATFGVMSLYGYVTKRDLTSWGSFLFMGVMGLFIASIINMFVRSASANLTIAYISVILFVLYTAYDVQNLKKLYTFVGINSDFKERIAIMGALSLYIDFINLFLSLLRIMSHNRNNRN